MRSTSLHHEMTRSVVTGYREDHAIHTRLAPWIGGQRLDLQRMHVRTRRLAHARRKRFDHDAVHTALSACTMLTHIQVPSDED